MKDFISGCYDCTLQQTSNKNLTANAYLESLIQLVWHSWRWLVQLYPLIMWSRELFWWIVELRRERSCLRLTFSGVYQGVLYRISPCYKKISSTFSA